MQLLGWFHDQPKENKPQFTAADDLCSLVKCLLYFHDPVIRAKVDAIHKEPDADSLKKSLALWKLANKNPLVNRLLLLASCGDYEALERDFRHGVLLEEE